MCRTHIYVTDSFQCAKLKSAVRMIEIEGIEKEVKGSLRFVAPLVLHEVGV